MSLGLGLECPRFNNGLLAHCLLSWTLAALAATMLVNAGRVSVMPAFDFALFGVSTPLVLSDDDRLRHFVLH